MQIEEKRKEEKKSMEIMVRLYCRKIHHTKTEEGLCPECKELLAYAHMRTEKCPFMETKTFCSACRVHCYAPDKRLAVKKVMRFAGPRMLFVNPKMALKHVGVTLLDKIKKDGNVADAAE